MSGRRLHAWLKDEAKFRLRSGKQLTISNIYITLRNPFYYGHFEYPRGSGRWYEGKHKPLIDKDLFDTVQGKIASYASHSERSKEFAFTKLMTCALCGSGITADEKFKKQKNGKTHRYVYYGCCRFQDKHCKGGYMREEDLIEQLANLMDKIDLDEIGMKERIKTEIERHKKFQANILGGKSAKVKVGDIDIRNYAKYILRDGSMTEKRELLSCLRSRITMAKKEVKIV